ncbi:MAG: ATP-binding protein [Bacteroidota bacterium]
MKFNNAIKEMKGLKKIAIIGPESTGKSTLSQELADHFHTEWVPEFARTYLDQLDRPYEKSDLITIAKGQLVSEDEKGKEANQYLFCDTNLITIKIWSDHKYGTTDFWIEEQLKSRTYEFYLLTYVDIEWAFDPQREHPNLRNHFYELFRSYLERHDLPYATIQGRNNDRKDSAIRAIASHFRGA